MINIRPVEINDLEGIQQVAQKTWVETYKNIYSIDFINRFLNNAYSSSNLERSITLDLEQTERMFLIAEDKLNKDIVGYAHLSKETEGVYELLRIYISPEFQGQGIGRDFLYQFIHGIRLINQVKAWVETDNSIGRGFYERMNFKKIQEIEEIVEGQRNQLVCYEWQINIL